jgi:dihydrofolate reductase
VRRLGFYIILTADGLYADPEGGLGHYEPAEDEHRYANELIRDSGDIVYGRVMYEVMRYWDTVDVDDPAVPDVEREFARYWADTPKHVVSRGQPELGPAATLLEGDVVDAVRRLKEQPGKDIGLGCGADLLATLTSAGLVDSYRLLMTPTALGQGKALFRSLHAPLSLRLTGTRTFSSGSVLLEYEPAQSPPTDSPGAG